MPALDEAEHARDRLGGAEVKAMLVTPSNPPPSSQLLERMPALDEAEHARDRLGGAEVKASGAVAAEGQGPLLSAVVLEGEGGGGGGLTKGFRIVTYIAEG